MGGNVNLFCTVINLSAQMKWVQVEDYRHPGTLGVELAAATWKMNNRGVVSGWRDARDNLPPTVLCNSLGVSLKGGSKRGPLSPVVAPAGEERSHLIHSISLKFPLGLQRGFLWPSRSSCEEHLSIGLGRKQKKSHFLSNLILPCVLRV